MRDSNKKSPSKEGLATQLSLFGQFAFSRALGPRQPVLYLGVICVLVEVVDEARCQVFGFAFPLQWVNISITWVEDHRIDAGQCGGHLQIKDWDMFGFRFFDRTIQNRIDNTARIFN